MANHVTCNHWVTCDTPGCESRTPGVITGDDDHCHADDQAEKLGWAHYTENHNGVDVVDVCPTCLSSRPDLVALCAVEKYESI